ncbi:MAG: class I SAM-dependent methyltransferase [Chlorobi bacterium]|nr:class I SAM-dependent methyltransferase [Chlorobiota bacterium]
MKVYYDKKNNRLVYTGKTSDAKYWDTHWNKNTIEKLYPKKISKFDYAVNTTKKYLPKNSLILEGGCGTGQQVFKLQKSGYKVIGIDFAPETVKTVNSKKPELDIRLGDVRKLNFPDNCFDGYWSFGVIEHFYSGYNEILTEMHRVIKPAGYLFVTFPHMNMLRKIKAKKGKYPQWANNRNDIKNFFQFALDENKVIKDIKNTGFDLIAKQHLSGIKGLKDEIKLLKKPLQKIFDGRTLPAKAASFAISFIFGRFSSHSVLLIFKKHNS